jgi:hypothetical protein
MAANLERLSRDEWRRFATCPVNCQRPRDRISSLPDYLALVGSLLSNTDAFWFRGHHDVRWNLVPSALRFPTSRQRDSALGILRDFRRVAEIKLNRVPAAGEDLKWLQLAQHYGIPTRLLDWTESATLGLYFACIPSEREETDGMVFLINPKDISRLRGRRDRTSFDAHLHQDLIANYFRLNGTRTPRDGLPTIAINPVWNSERLMVQRGVFTLHGSRSFALDSQQAPSLVGLFIPREVKARLRQELGRIGVDEMTVFPELEHACRHLRRIGLGEGP